MSHPAINMTAWVAKQYIDGGYATLKGVNANYEAARLTYTGGLGSWGEVGQRFRWLFAPGSGFYCIRYGMHFNVNNVPTRATIDRARLYLSIDSREVSDGPFTPQIAEANWYLTPFVSDAAYDAILAAATAGTWENIGAVELDTPYYTSDLSPDWVKRDGTYTQYGIRSALDYEGTPPDIGDMEDEPYSKDSVARFTHAGLWEPLLRIDYHVTRWHPYQMEGELDTGFEAADLDAINAQWTPGTEDWWGDSRATIEGGSLVSDGTAHGGSKYLKGTAADPSGIAWTMPFYPMKWSYSFWLRLPDTPADDMYTIAYDENALQYGMDYYVDDGSGHPDSYYWYVETPGEGEGWTSTTTRVLRAGRSSSTGTTPPRARQAATWTTLALESPHLQRLCVLLGVGGLLLPGARR